MSNDPFAEIEAMLAKIQMSCSLNKQGTVMELMIDFNYHMSRLDIHKISQLQVIDKQSLENFRVQVQVQQNLNGFEILSITQFLMINDEYFFRILEAYELNRQIYQYILYNYFKVHNKKGFLEFVNIHNENERCLDQYYQSEIIKLASITNFSDLEAYIRSNTLFELKQQQSCILKFEKYSNQQTFHSKLYEKILSLNMISLHHPIYKEIAETMYNCYIDSYQLEKDEVLANKVVNINDPNDDVIKWWQQLDEITFTQQFTKLFYHYSGLNGEANQSLLYFHSKFSSSSRLMINLLGILYTVQGELENQKYQHDVKKTAIKDGLLDLPYGCKLPLEAVHQIVINQDGRMKFELNKLQYSVDKSRFQSIQGYLELFTMQITNGLSQCFNYKFDIYGYCKSTLQKATNQINEKYMELHTKLNEFQVIGESSSNNITIIITGFLTNDKDMLISLLHLIDRNSKVIRFNWYSSSKVEILIALISFALGAVIASTISDRNILMNLFKDWDWTWFAKIHELAKEVGCRLAELIIQNYSKGNIKLIGHSLGTVVIYYCLQRLEQLSENRIIQDILLLGGVQDVTDWGKLSYKNVFGKIINTYSKSDWVLWIFINMCSNPCGFHPILNHKMITNVQKDIYHTEYFNNLQEIIQQSDFGNNIHELYKQ